jgi:hypothetical protein
MSRGVRERWVDDEMGKLDEDGEVGKGGFGGLPKGRFVGKWNERLGINR